MSAAVESSVADEMLESSLQEFVGRARGPAVARDAVNQPMIRHWCDALGDVNPVYTEPDLAAISLHGSIVAPPTMLQVWNLGGLTRFSDPKGPFIELLKVLDGAGFSSLVATNCEQEYHRYLRPGDLLTEDVAVESVSSLKRTALGEGFFVTNLTTYHDQDGALVGTMRLRVFKFRPAGSAPGAEEPTAPGSQGGTGGGAAPEGKRGGS